MIEDIFAAVDWTQSWGVFMMVLIAVLITWLLKSVWPWWKDERDPRREKFARDRLELEGKLKEREYGVRTLEAEAMAALAVAVQTIHEVMSKRLWESPGEKPDGGPGTA